MTPSRVRMRLEKAGYSGIRNDHLSGVRGPGRRNYFEVATAAERAGRPIELRLRSAGTGAHEGGAAGVGSAGGERAHDSSCSPPELSPLALTSRELLDQKIRDYR
jgi:hypothetical protein